MNRRNFLGSLALASTGCLLAEKSEGTLETNSNISNFYVLQGFTDESTTQFSIDLPRRLNVHYEVIDKDTHKVFLPVRQSSGVRSFSNERVDQVAFADLNLGSSYLLMIKSDRNEILDARGFKMLDTNKKVARIGVLSCMLDLNDNQSEMWNLVRASRCDMLFLIGDNVYGDIFGIVHGPKTLWSRYMTTRSIVDFYSEKQLTPTIAIWDDHDYGHNEQDGNYIHKGHSLRTFKEFYAQTPMGLAYNSGPGISSSFSGFGQKFIFLDDRYWRNLSNRIAHNGYLGYEQIVWLEKELQHDQMQTWIVQGSQTFGRYKEESGTYEYLAPIELAYVMSKIRSTGKPTVFVSGDVHFSEIKQIARNHLGYNSFELTSSCLHSIFMDRLPASGERIEGATRENFLVIDVNAWDHNFTVQCLGIGGKVKFTRNLAAE